LPPVEIPSLPTIPPVVIPCLPPVEIPRRPCIPTEPIYPTISANPTISINPTISANPTLIVWPNVSTGQTFRHDLDFDESSSRSDMFFPELSDHRHHDCSSEPHQMSLPKKILTFRILTSNRPLERLMRFIYGE